MLTENGTSPGERSVQQSTKLKGVGDLKSALTSDMEMQSLEYAQLACFGPIFPYHDILEWLCIFCTMLEVCDLLFDFDFLIAYRL